MTESQPLRSCLASGRHGGSVGIFINCDLSRFRARVGGAGCQCSLWCYLVVRSGRDVAFAGDLGWRVMFWYLC